MTGLAWSPSSQQLASCSRNSSVSIWDVSTGKRLHQLSGIKDVVRDVDWSRDGTKLAANIGGSVTVWETSNWKQVSQVEIGKHTLHSLAFSPDSQKLLTVGHDRNLRIISGDSIDLVTERDANEHLFAAGWSNDGRYIAAGLAADGPRIWSTDSLNELLTLEDCQARIRTSKFTSDNRLIIWDLERVLGIYCCVVSAYCTGGNLAEFKAKRSLSYQEIAELATFLAEALDFLPSQRDCPS